MKTFGKIIALGLCICATLKSATLSFDYFTQTHETMMAFATLLLTIVGLLATSFVGSLLDKTQSHR